MKNNNLKGTWELVSAEIQNQEDTIALFGKNPSGSLIFTGNMLFSALLYDRDVPKFISEDRSQGTCEELRAATKGALALYGTYTVDENGNFDTQQIMGSTFPNWNGLVRTSNQLRLERKGHLLIENLSLENNALVTIKWHLIQD